ncbi:unnamed protein product [Merluccius merluccius]
MANLTLPTPVPRASYSQARENLVKAIPPRILCLLACGGVDCRYEGPAHWRANQQAIRGLFSSWVTDDIVAMARPSSHLLEKFNIVEQFHRLNIKSIINMQLPGEHAHCGPPLDAESGFTYSPQSFMENNIFFYNFGMPDFGVSSMVGIIDGVKVLAFAAKEGRVAVHCHAGLGRTGVLIACYLVYTLRISPSEAVHYVRIKRPRSIQTRAQIQHVFDFARLLGTQLAQYPDLSFRHGGPFTLQHYLNRQALLLHGPEARALRHTPKVVYLLCVRLSCLALGVPAPPEIHAELEKRAGLRTLGRAVRETLVSKQYLPLLKEGHRGSWVGSSDSVSSWDEPVGFWERKRELLVNKRSYSDSDLAKITVNKVSHSKRRVSLKTVHKESKQYKFPSLSSSSAERQSNQKEKQTTSRVIPTLVSKTNNCNVPRSRCTGKNTPALPTFSSNVELRRNHQKPGLTSAARLVAKAMANQDPPGETALQRSALLQEELNSSECGWTLLVTETDPHVLSCLLWSWLEKLKEPVLSPGDIEKITSGANHTNPLAALRMPQRHTISCLLSCVGTVLSLCPHREDAVLQRLLRALTWHPPEETARHAALIKVFKDTSRETMKSNVVPPQ